MAVLIVNHGMSEWLAILVAVCVGLAIGLVYGALFVWVGVPSFVFSSRACSGSRGCCSTSWARTARSTCPTSRTCATSLGPVGQPHVSYILVAAAVLLFVAGQLLTIRSRKAAGLSTPWLPMVAIKAIALAVGLGLITWYVNDDRGWSYLWVFFVFLVIIVDFALRRTTWGRHVFAVGGQVEAARRSGIKVNGSTSPSSP